MNYLAVSVLCVSASKANHAETRFSIEEHYTNASLVKASPVTGLTHQIRVHTQYAEYPIALDDKYGG